MDSPLPAGSVSSGTSSVFVVFIAEEVDGLGDRGSGDTTTVDIQTLLEAVLNMSLRSAFFSGKSKIFALGATLLKCHTIRISRLLDFGLKEFCFIK